MALKNIRLKINILLLLTTITSLITITILQLTTYQFENIFQMLSILTYSLLTSFIGTIAFQLIFESKIKRYFVLIFANSFFHIALIPLYRIINLSLYIIFPLISICWLILFLSIEKPDNDSTDFLSFTKLGITSFLINSSVSFILLLDKFIANHYFSEGLANTYSFSWAIIAPLFYLGNVVERLVFSSKSENVRLTFLKSICLQLGINFLYFFAGFSYIKYFPQYLPSSVDKSLLLSIYLMMSAGYLVYTLFQFPLNGILYRYGTVIKQNVVGYLHAAAMLLFVVIFAFTYKTINSYTLLLTFIFAFIISTLIIKAAMVLPIVKGANAKAA